MFTNFEIKNEQINALSPVALAFIGDSVYDLFVRTDIVSKNNLPISKLHRLSSSHVNSSAQSKSFFKIEDQLSEDELHIYKRGRNAKSMVPKNADVSEYRTATGLEALIGYIYLKKDEKRLIEIMNLILEVE